jgi:hypothetical protein
VHDDDDPGPVEVTEPVGDTALEVMVAAQVVKMAETGALGNDEEFTAANAMIDAESRVALNEPEVLRFKAVSRIKAVVLNLPMSHSPEPANPLGSLGELRYRDDFYSGRSPMSTKKTQAKSGACLDKRYVAWAIGCMHSGNGFETTSRRTPGMAAAMPTTT